MNPQDERSFRNVIDRIGSDEGIQRGDEALFLWAHAVLTASNTFDSSERRDKGSVLFENISNRAKNVLTFCVRADGFERERAYNKIKLAIGKRLVQKRTAQAL